MRVMYELLTSSLGFPIEPIYEYILIFIINEIAFAYAYKESPGGQFGSLIHYLFRIPSFIILWFLAHVLISVSLFVYDQY